MNESNTNEKPEHLFVKNPYTGKLVNLMPLFQLTGNAFGSAQGAAQHLQLVHDFISTSVIMCTDESRVDPDQLVDMNRRQVTFRNTLERSMSGLFRLTDFTHRDV